MMILPAWRWRWKQLGGGRGAVCNTIWRAMPSSKVV